MACLLIIPSLYGTAFLSCETSQVQTKPSDLILSKTYFVITAVQSIGLLPLKSFQSVWRQLTGPTEPIPPHTLTHKKQGHHI